jgi:predicted ATPase/DNA-binding SARP family transcriptional activator
VLAQLVLSAGEPVSATRLIDAVWGEWPPQGAGRSLEVYASRLRKAIAATGAQIVRRGSGYELVLGPARVDALEFATLAREGREALAAGDPEAARRKLESALALWRARALADLDGDAGADLDEQRTAAAEDLADAELLLGRHAELVPELERRVREEPLRERTRAQLMLALYRSGRQAESLEAFRQARAALDALGLEPGSALRDLELAILRQDAMLDVEPRDVRERRRLPAPATALIGRGPEIDELTRLLRGPARLVTLTGPGGIGKTRLALAVAHELAAAFVDGVWFVALAPLADAALVAQTIASTLGVGEGALVEELGPRELLLVLDNFEHVLEAAPLVSELLATAPRVKVLATSRSRLDLYGEEVVPVPPLSAEQAETLFLARARAARHGFAAGAGVAELCERFDRLPLALELVAARARDLTLAELLESAGLDLAGSGPRDLPERQRTLRSAIAWSEQQLDDEQRTLFAALGIFAGGFERDAVMDVCPDGARHLPALVDAALVLRAGDGRLRMLATVRDYAVERLDEAGERVAVGGRHLGHYVALAERLAPLLLGAGDAGAQEQLERERDNLRAALGFARDHGLTEPLLKLVRDLSRFWYVHGDLSEGGAWAEAALAHADGPPLLRAQALKGAALLDWKRGDLDLAEARAEEARRTMVELGEETELSGALSVLAAIAYGRGDVAAAAAQFEANAALARRLGMASHLSIALNNVAGIHYEAGDWAAARHAYEESLEVARGLGSKELEAFAQYGLGAVSLHVGELEDAERRLIHGLERFRELRFPDRVASCCTYLAALARARGDQDGAARLLGAAAGLRDGSTAATDRLELELAERTRSQVEAALGAREFAAAFGTGVAAPEAVLAPVLEATTSTLDE